MQWPSDCGGADSLVLQSFSSYMPLSSNADIFRGHSEVTQAIPVIDMQVILVLSGPKDAEYAYGVELADRVRLVEIAHVSSAFGSLMYDMLVSRPKLALCSGSC